MTLQNIPLLQAIGAKMQYLNERQGVIADNIANSDTPGYRAKDLTPINFGAILENVTKGNKIAMAKTESGQGITPGGSTKNVQAKIQKVTYEVTPSGNGVVLEEQMVKASENIMDYNLMTNLMRKQISLIRMALGRQQ